jgi:hypothetical protein
MRDGLQHFACGAYKPARAFESLQDSGDDTGLVLWDSRPEQAMLTRLDLRRYLGSCNRWLRWTSCRFIEPVRQSEQMNLLSNEALYLLSAFLFHSSGSGAFLRWVA